MLRILLILYLLQSNFGFSQTYRVDYHLQKYESIMDSVQGDFKSYLNENWSNFLLLKNDKILFADVLLTSDLLVFQNHNLFSKGPLNLLEENFEHFFNVEGDSISFWFGQFGMNGESIQLKHTDSTYILFPSSDRGHVTVINRLKSGKYKYDTYIDEGEEYRIESVVKRRNKFRHALGIKNKRNLFVMLFN